MATLVVGASGATGKLLVEQLLKSGQQIKVIVRPTSTIPDSWNTDPAITLIRSNISEIGLERMVKHLADCESVASCLGHSMTWKGIYGHPGKLVTDTVRLVAEAALKEIHQKPIKFILMNTAGNRNRDLTEPVSFGQKIMIGLVRLLLPPHTDNEKASDYLRIDIGQNNPAIEWAVVRPDTLINEDEVTDYSTYSSPTRSAIFNPGKTSRINVAHFMKNLITDEKTWSRWKGKMPVIYNA
ncbi:NAD(P)-dependent oxidoreductase [Algoriphagus sp. Y33]|uniref:NAD(P)-dependent oxidoreductase n=1 Tax=Algoriphagus sp. Y33 TaxID=2772483 RepID=UPI0017868D4C|nr:NAD(P)-binding oxidoreductase [Algoriphagus sp. Y33]